MIIALDIIVPLRTVLGSFMSKNIKKDFFFSIYYSHFYANQFWQNDDLVSWFHGRYCIEIGVSFKLSSHKVIPGPPIGIFVNVTQSLDRICPRRLSRCGSRPHHSSPDCHPRLRRACVQERVNHAYFYTWLPSRFPTALSLKTLWMMPEFILRFQWKCGKRRPVPWAGLLARAMLIWSSFSFAINPILSALLSSTVDGPRFTIHC